MDIYDYVRQNNVAIAAVRDQGCWAAQMPDHTLAHRSTPEIQSGFRKTRSSLPSALAELFLFTMNYALVRRGETTELPPLPRPGNGSWTDEVQNLLRPREGETG